MDPWILLLPGGAPQLHNSPHAILSSVALVDLGWEVLFQRQGMGIAICQGGIPSLCPCQLQAVCQVLAAALDSPLSFPLLGSGQL